MNESLSLLKIFSIMDSVIKSVGKRNKSKEVEIVDKHNPLNNLNWRRSSVLNVNEGQGDEANEETIGS